MVCAPPTLDTQPLLAQGLRDHDGEKLNPDAELVIDNKSEG
jgi:hypothetical protein